MQNPTKALVNSIEKVKALIESKATIQNENKHQEIQTSQKNKDLLVSNQYIKVQQHNTE